MPVERTVASPRVLAGALEALLEGPTAAEQARATPAGFSSQTAGLLNDVRIDDGVATVDSAAELADVIPGASSSTGSAALLASLDALH